MEISQTARTASTVSLTNLAPTQAAEKSPGDERVASAERPQADSVDFSPRGQWAARAQRNNPFKAEAEPEPSAPAEDGDLEISLSITIEPSE